MKPKINFILFICFCLLNIQNNCLSLRKETSFLEIKKMDTELNDFGLTPTINIKEPQINFDLEKDLHNLSQASENKPRNNIIGGFIKPKIVNYLQKQDKIIAEFSNKKDNHDLYSVEYKKEKKIEDDVHRIAKAYNYEPKKAEKNSSFIPAAKVYNDKSLSKPEIVKNLRKDLNLMTPLIPPSFLPVQKVKELTPAAQVDLKLKQFYHE